MYKKRVALVPKGIFQSLYFVIYVALFTTSFVVHAQNDDTLKGGVQVHADTSADGYVLFSPQMQTNTYLIDKQGQVINIWKSDYMPASAMYLLDNGHLIRAGRSGGGESEAIRVIEEFDWDGNLLWEYIFDAPQFTQHHDIQPMPNGNILVLAKEHIPMDEAVELGFDLDLLETIPNRNTNEPLDEVDLDSIFEINPQTDAVVWEWHVSDHLIQATDPDLPNYGEIAEFPRRINLNYHDVPRVTDTIHMNSVAYNSDSDLIIVSVRSFSEFWVIDHNLTTEDARGTQGDLLYRWGNPATYGQGTDNDRTLFYQHDARWVDDSQAESQLTVFNNGTRSTQQSHVIEFSFPREWMTNNSFNPPEILWESTLDVFAINMSGGQYLPNSNILITLAPDGRFVEINRDNEIVWEYINPIYQLNDDVAENRVFRATFYPADFVGFEGKTLQPLGELEITIR